MVIRPEATLLHVLSCLESARLLGTFLAPDVKVNQADIAGDKPLDYSLLCDLPDEIKSQRVKLLLQHGAEAKTRLDYNEMRPKWCGQQTWQVLVDAWKEKDGVTRLSEDARDTELQSLELHQIGDSMFPMYVKTD